MNLEFDWIRFCANYENKVNHLFVTHLFNRAGIFIQCVVWLSPMRPFFCGGADREKLERR